MKNITTGCDEHSYVPYWVNEGPQLDFLKSLSVGDLIIDKRGIMRTFTILDINVEYAYGDTDKYYSYYKVFVTMDGTSSITMMDAAEILEAADLFWTSNTPTGADGIVTEDWMNPT